jgi:lipid II:glycine glycyltransferase (peptidoglycan interpeptide bridge formation enzyme)
MRRAVAIPGWAMNQQTWDLALQRMGGNLLQSWRWGAFKERQGWTVHRLLESDPGGAWMAQFLVKRQGPVGIAYVPCGPTLAGDHQRHFDRMMAAVDDLCRQERALTLIMEPNQWFELPGSYKDHGLVKWRQPFQPRTTMTVPVADDDTMLGRMHRKTRYHVRLAGRNGFAVTSKPVTRGHLQAFYALHAEMASRNGIRTLQADYFGDLLAAFGRHSELLFAEREGRPAAGALLTRFGDQANYMFAGSCKQHRGQGAGAAVIFQSLQWAREHGCAELDLGNIGTPGLREFKAGFGGAVREFPAPMERRLRPLLSVGVRRYLTAKTL